MFDKGICVKSCVKLTLVPFVTRKLEVLLHHSRFFKQIIYYSNITPGRVKSIIDHKAAVLGVNLNPQTIICDFEAGLTSLIQGYFPNTRVHGCYFHFSKAVHRKVGELELNRNRRKNIRMLLATVFLPVPQVDTGVSLLEAGTTGPLAALFQYFWQEWMSDERPPHWNVRDVSLRTNSHLE
ncbi:hypothetical protein T06_9764, partial [Trichinella sp. T6]